RCRPPATAPAPEGGDRARAGHESRRSTGSGRRGSAAPRRAPARAPPAGYRPEFRQVRLQPRVSAKAAATRQFLLPTPSMGSGGVGKRRTLPCVAILLGRPQDEAARAVVRQPAGGGRSAKAFRL